MLDHALDGRLIFGISPGGLLSDAEVFGNLDADRNAMFLEAINQVLQIWANEPPYDLQGKYWNVSVQKTLIADIGQGFIARPLQRPHPPIVVTAVAPFSKGVTKPRRAVGTRSQPTPDACLRRATGQNTSKDVNALTPGGRRELARCQSIFVAKDAATAKAYATDPERTVCLLLSPALS
jgi:hypothetical protein